MALADPLVAAYLARLDQLSAALPPARRAELGADIRGHLSEALAGVPAGDQAGVRAVLDRLGAPEDIVAAETDGASSPATAPAAAAAPAAATGRGWGGLEIAAVLLLTVGQVVLFLVGPLIGLLLAWASPKWTRSEKVVATGLALLPGLLALVGVALLAVGSSTSEPAPAPVPSNVVATAEVSP